jgi:predicted RNA-binding Zn-ribbon protein involved in translation (DUF1610 family)
MKRVEFFKKIGKLAAGAGLAALPGPPAPPQEAPKPEMVVERKPLAVCPHCGRKVLIQQGSQLDPHETRIKGWGQHLQFTRFFCENCGWERIRTRRW